MTRSDKMKASAALLQAVRASLAMVEALIAATPHSDDPNALNGLHQWRGTLRVSVKRGTEIEADNIAAARIALSDTSPTEGEGA